MKENRLRLLFKSLQIYKYLEVGGAHHKAWINHIFTNRDIFLQEFEVFCFEKLPVISFRRAVSKRFRSPSPLCIPQILYESDCFILVDKIKCSEKLMGRI